MQPSSLYVQLPFCNTSCDYFACNEIIAANCSRLHGAQRYCRNTTFS
jgi:coproporphyrinogen III oxidase-like Fe-S oxidoreductase